jgi:hypothetical protein
MRVITFLCCVSLFTPAVLPANILLAPDSGSISGLPGSAIGWGFVITNDSQVDWISFEGSVLINETNPGLGSYMDFIGPQGGPQNALLGRAGMWSESFSDAMQTGIGEFLIAPGTPLGALDSGDIHVFWESWDGDPATCKCGPAEFSADLPFQVTAEAPEPDSFWVLLAGGVWLLLRQRRRGSDDAKRGNERGGLYRPSFLSGRQRTQE